MKQINEQERLDSPDVPFEERWFLLNELDRVNKWAGVYATFLGLFKGFFMARLRPLIQGQRFSILEIGGGSGGLAAQIIPYMKKRGYDVDYHILDMDPRVLRSAHEQLKGKGFNVTVHHAGDQHLKIFEDRCFDVVISLHVLHHIYPAGILQSALKDSLRVARRGVFMVDLDRRFSFIVMVYLAKIFLGYPPLLSGDAVKSARRAYRPHETRAILNQANDTGGYTCNVQKLWWAPYQTVTAWRNV